MCSKFGIRKLISVWLIFIASFIIVYSIIADYGTRYSPFVISCFSTSAVFAGLYSSTKKIEHLIKKKSDKK